MLFLLTLGVVGGVALYVMTPEERVRLARRIVAALQPLATAAAPRPQERAFAEALQARNRRAIVVPALAFVNVVLFLRMLLGAGALADPQTLLAWGGNFAPRTTNGEWWRIVTAMFLHDSFMGLIANTIGLLAVGLVIERIAGPAIFALTYVAAGMAGALALLFMNPLAVGVGAMPAVLGVYGLTIGTGVWIFVAPGALAVPLPAAKRMAGAASIFFFYALVTGGLTDPLNGAGLAVGLTLGLALTPGVGVRVPPLRRTAAASGLVMVLTIACTVPLRGIADVGPEIARVVAAEDRTAALYQQAVAQFVKGRATATELAALVERSIVPDLQAAGARMQTLGNIPQTQRVLVTDTCNYVRLRIESWRLRADGLRKGNMRILREADKIERASLQAFERIRSSEG
jgi:rhomboid protease GluP